MPSPPRGRGPPPPEEPESPEEQTAARPPPGALSDAPVSWGGESSGARQRKGARGGEGAEFAGCRSRRHGGPGSLPPSSLPRAGSQPLVWGLGAPGERQPSRAKGPARRGVCCPHRFRGQRAAQAWKQAKPPPAWCPPPALELWAAALLKGAPRAGVSAGTGEWGLELGICFLYYHVPCDCSSVWHHCN